MLMMPLVVVAVAVAMMMNWVAGMTMKAFNRAAVGLQIASRTLA